MEGKVWIFVEEAPFLQRLAPFSSKELCQEVFEKSLAKAWSNGTRDSEAVDGNGNTFAECVSMLSWWDGERTSLHAYESVLDDMSTDSGSLFPF